MLNVFLLHSPYQLYTAQLILRQYFLEGARNVLVLEGGVPKGLLDSGLWRSVYFVKYSSTVRESRQGVREICRIIEKEMKGGGGRIFLSDIAWPANNAVFFSSRFKAVPFYIVSDGIGSYMGRRISKKMYIRNVVKSFSGALGITSPYVPYCGDNMGMSHPRVSGIYGYQSHMLSGMYAAPVYEIDINSSGDDFCPSTCLFLDQPFKDYFSRGQWREIRVKTVSYLRRMAFDSIYYKPHPRCTEDYKEDFAFDGVVPVLDTRPAELVCADIRAGTVVSYVSSALFNIKSMHGDAVQCISLSPSHFEASLAYSGQVEKSVVDLYKGVGVAVVDEFF